MANRVFLYLKTAAPTVNDDTGDGYAIGDLWIDETNDKVYQALNVTVGAAVWVELTGGGGGGAWGDITGTLADQTDLQTALDAKEATANKVTTMSGNTTSNIVFLTAKAIYDWAIALFSQLGHSHAASDITSGTMATARLGSGTANSSKRLAGDSTWVDGREVLAANRTYYVRTDGSDSNNGLANTAGGAFLTIQKAINTAAALDLSTYSVTIQVGNGTYTENLSLKSFIGQGTITILGDETTLTNVSIAPSSGTVITADTVTGKWILRGFSLTPTNAAGLGVINNSIVDFKNLRFAGSYTSVPQIGLSGNATLTAIGNYTIAASAYIHVYVSAGSIFNCYNITVTLTGTPAWAYAGWVADRVGIMVASGMTFSGSATGVRYRSDLNSVLYTNGGGASYFPGNSAGATSAGGQYV